MKEYHQPRPWTTLRIALLLACAGAFFVLALLIPSIQSRQEAKAVQPAEPVGSISTSTSTPFESQSARITAMTQLPSVEQPGSQENSATTLIDEIFVFSINDQGFSHLFAYHPQNLPFTRLTNEPWDDMDPALSPDGSQLAFSSRRNGYWDLYILDLSTGNLSRVTDTPDYEGAPSWSPDSAWLAYESYKSNNMDIYIQSVGDSSLTPVRLTDDPASDSNPSWSPLGRQIAFVSNREGEDDIFIADLDVTGDRFQNLTKNLAGDQYDPDWSSTGMALAWGRNSKGDQSIYRLEFTTGPSDPIRLGNGSSPHWSPDGKIISALLQEPNNSSLFGYSVENQLIHIPPFHLAGAVHGYDWNISPDKITSSEYFRRLTHIEPEGDGLSIRNDSDEGSRTTLSQLADVIAPQAYLVESAVESFQLLRDRTAYETGWDFLGSLENAYVPLTNPLPPGMGTDWLYTGRAIAFTTAALNPGWLFISLENFGANTYWRVYVKTRYQDGSQGRPVTDHAWDLEARYSGNPEIYEEGGAQSSLLPEGYWVDLTDLAQRYGWLRVSALLNWRTFYQGVRYNELVLSTDLTWEEALKQIYPPEALLTPTEATTSTTTPTRVPTWYVSNTSTLEPTSTLTPTPRPTWTPLAPTPAD